MAQALAEGFAATGALKPCQIGACARDRAKLRRNTEPKGFLAFDDAARVAEFADMVIVAVKPHQVEAVLSPVKELLAEKDVKYFHDLAGEAVDGMEKDVLSAMGMFALE